MEGLRHLITTKQTLPPTSDSAIGEDVLSIEAQIESMKSNANMEPSLKRKHLNRLYQRRKRRDKITIEKERERIYNIVLDSSSSSDSKFETTWI